MFPLRDIITLYERGKSAILWYCLRKNARQRGLSWKRFTSGVRAVPLALLVSNMGPGPDGIPVPDLSRTFFTITLPVASRKLKGTWYRVISISFWQQWKTAWNEKCSEYHEKSNQTYHRKSFFHEGFHFFSGFYWPSLALTGSLPVSLWLSMALCDSHSGSLWL